MHLKRHVSIAQGNGHGLGEHQCVLHASVRLRRESQREAVFDDGQRVFVESNTTALPYLPQQEILMMNHVALQWELIDARVMSNSDLLLEFTISDDPQRFINPQNANEIRMRVDVFDPGLVFYPDWSASFDQARWEMVLN